MADRANKPARPVEKPVAEDEGVAVTGETRQSFMASLVSAAGYILAVSYPLLALSTGVRAGYQLFFKEDVVYYWPSIMSAIAALSYLVATIGFAYRRRWSWWLSVGALGFETTMTLLVGTYSYVEPELVGRTVWRHFGEDYGYFPFFQPLIGLIWLFWPATMQGLRHPENRHVMQSNTTLATPLPKRARGTQISQAHALLNLLAGLIAVAMLLPVAYLLLRALGVGARTLDLIVQPRTAIVVSNSVSLALIVTVLSLCVALPMAWLTVRTDLPGRRIWGVLAVLPLVFPSYVGGYAFVAMMGPRGIVQQWLEPLGIDRLPSIYGLPGAAWVLTIFTYPYLLLSIRAGLRNLDPALEEAARNLGYGPWQTFRKVTLPALRPAISAGALLVALYVLSDFGAVSILRYNSFTRVIYLQYLNSFDRSLAALLSLVLVALTVLLLFSAQRFQGKQRLYRSAAGATRVANTVTLGRWRWPSLILCTLLIFVALVAPAGVIVYWLWRGVAAGESLQPLYRATFNSIQAATLAAVAAIFLAMPVSYLAVRYPGRYSLIVSQSVYLGYGLPGIVIALSLVFFGANYAPWFYQTLIMLIFAYVIRFLPQGVGSVRTGLLQISPRLEEAARSLGLNRRRTVWHITLPLLRPAIWTGAAIVFLSTMKELPATLLLGPTGFATLATQIWSAADEAFFARAAAPSLLLLAVSALSIVIILGQEERVGS